MELAPIIVFTYNRLKHTQLTIDALLKNHWIENSILYIFSDGPKNEEDLLKVNQVRNYIKTIKGVKQLEIIECEYNQGLAESIIHGVTKIVNQYQKVIVLEDDLITSPYFLKYMNNALVHFENSPEVISIHGYLYPLVHFPDKIFFLKGADCWGWATWKRGWDIFEKDGTLLYNKLVSNKLTKAFDYNNSYPFTLMLKDQSKGKSNSWAIRWYAAAFLENKLTLYPPISLVHNIGLDNSGTHGKKTDDFNTLIGNKEIAITSIPLEENIFVKGYFEDYFNKINRFKIRNIYNRILKLLKI